MNLDKQTEYSTRDTLLSLLSDDEVASVSTAETAGRLCDGDEYLDLKHLSGGVLRARGEDMPMGRVLPKKAVRDDTWRKILRQLGSSRPLGA